MTNIVEKFYKLSRITLMMLCCLLFLANNDALANQSKKQTINTSTISYEEDSDIKLGQFFKRSKGKSKSKSKSKGKKRSFFKRSSSKSKSKSKSKGKKRSFFKRSGSKSKSKSKSKKSGRFGKLLKSAASKAQGITMDDILNAPAKLEEAKAKLEKAKERVDLLQRIAEDPTNILSMQSELIQQGQEIAGIQGEYPALASQVLGAFN